MGLRLVIPSLRRMVRQPVDVVLGSWRRHKWRPHYLLPFCCETSLKIESQHLWEGLSRCGGVCLSQASTRLSGSISLQDYSCKSEAARLFWGLNSSSVSIQGQLQFPTVCFYRVIVIIGDFTGDSGRQVVLEPRMLPRDPQVSDRHPSSPSSLLSWTKQTCSFKFYMWAHFFFLWKIEGSEMTSGEIMAPVMLARDFIFPPSIYCIGGS